MKLIDIANKIDKSAQNEDWISVYTLAKELNIPMGCSYAESSRIKCYWIGKWYCTDSYVGYRMYFFDDIPVAVSSQAGRKCDEIFEWFSRELALQVKEHVISLLTIEEEPEYFSIGDINTEIGDTYKVYFNGQVLHPEKATFLGKPVKIVEYLQDDSKYAITASTVLIELPDGEQLTVKVGELDFKFNLIED